MRHNKPLATVPPDASSLDSLNRRKQVALLNDYLHPVNRASPTGDTYAYQQLLP
jgi:hypothetical protein